MELSTREKIEYLEALLNTIKRNIFQYQMTIAQYTGYEEKGEVTKDHMQNMTKFKSMLIFNEREYEFYTPLLAELKAKETLELPVSETK